MYGGEAGDTGRSVGHIHGFPGYATAEKALRNTLDHHPDHLDTYVDLCKLCFYSKRFTEAEQTARAALIESARQGGFDPDWRVLVPTDVEWRESGTPHRVYLYMLKALAFIRMRRLDIKDGRAILGHLERLDPDDLVGGSVVRDLAGAVSDGGKL